MTRKDIIDGLIKKGYPAMPYDKVENGKKIEGIVINNNLPVTPVIYTQRYIESAERENISIEEVVNDFIYIYKAKLHVPEGSDIDKLFDKNFAREHVHIGVQKTSTEHIEKKNIDLEGIEAYLYIRSGKGKQTYAMKIQPEIVEALFNDSGEAWTCAKKNTFAETTIKDMNEMVRESGSACTDGIIPGYILSNKSWLRGRRLFLINQHFPGLHKSIK